MDIYSFFSEMGEVETRYGHWVLEAVGAGGESTDVTWDQYLEVRTLYDIFRSKSRALNTCRIPLRPSARSFVSPSVRL